jgi:hypothetical protein
VRKLCFRTQSFTLLPSLLLEQTLSDSDGLDLGDGLDDLDDGLDLGDGLDGLSRWGAVAPP